VPAKQALTNVFTVQVRRTDADAQGGFHWLVTFDPQPGVRLNRGDLPLLALHSESITAPSTAATDATAEDAAAASRRGWLQVLVEAGDAPSWKKRWCVLVGARLEFFGGEQAASAHPPQPLGSVRRALLACLATTVVRWASLSKVSDDVGLLRKMIMSMTYVRIAAGEDVFCEGEIGETFYVIVTGVLSVNVEGSGVVKKMGAGESFGEMALLDRQNCTRSATVTVERDRDYCELCVVSRKDFEDSVASHLH